MEATVLGPLFDDALAFASEVHRDDLRKGTKIPYLSHPLAVASLVMEDGGGENEVIAALLHDVAEDHGGEEALTKIADSFNDRVAELVRGCSDSLEPEVADKGDWAPRKQAHVSHLMEVDRETGRIVLADKLHNARCILRDLRTSGRSLWDRFSGGKDGTLWYLAETLEVFEQRENTSGKRLNSPMLGELRWAVTQIQLLAVRRPAVQLREGKNPAVDAYIHENGDLTFLEQILLPGGEDSEYYAGVPADRKDAVLLELIRDRFTGVEGIKEIEAWLGEHDFPFGVFVR